MVRDVSISRWIAGALLTTGLLVAASCDAQAQTICTSRAVMVEKLKAELNEKLDGVGITSSGSLLELFVSPNGTWTVLSTNAIGMSCLALSGDGWTSQHKIVKEGES